MKTCTSSRSLLRRSVAAVHCGAQRLPMVPVRRAAGLAQPSPAWLWSPLCTVHMIRGTSTFTRSTSQSATSETFDFDLFTIGAGSGGVRASRFASSYGAKVAVAEKPYGMISSDAVGGVGGTCVLRGCVPKKLMVYASEYAEMMRDAAGFGWQVPEGRSHDWGVFMEAKRKELLRLNGAYKNTLNNAKVTLIEGRGRITGPHTVEVDGRTYTAKNILVAVGATSAMLNIPGAELCINSDDILDLPERPKKVSVIGGGYIAVEFSGILTRFGSEVHTVFRQPLPLRGFDEEVRKFAAEQYTAAGLHLHPGMVPVEVRKQTDGRLTLVLADSDGKQTEIKDNDQVLMATGRVPNTANLGLEQVGVEMGAKGQIKVDDYLRTSVPSIWAVGDVIDKIQLTPVALMEGMALAKTVALNQPTKPDYFAVPSAVFSHPEIGTVGLSEEQALAAHPNLDIFTASFRPMRNTLSGSPLRTFMKMIVDADSGKVLGMHMVGDYAGEIMQGFAVALKSGVTKAQVDSTIGIHPSAAEEFVTMRSPSRKIRNGQPA